MALLEDPTIQRILNEVNKAASGGVLGTAGNYISEPATTEPHFDSQLLSSSSENQFYRPTQTPLFYPTSEMFGIDGLTNFNDQIDFSSIPSMVPSTASSNFDLYTSNLYNTIPQSFLSPYETYEGMMASKTKQSQLSNPNSLRSTSSVSSAHNEMLIERHRHEEYPTVPPALASAVPNLGLNIRTTPPTLDSASIGIIEANANQLPADQSLHETKTSATPIMNSGAENENNKSSSPINNDDIDQQDQNGNIFYDPNPQVIQRKGSNSVTYKQNIIVRYLQPPPIPNAGPLIIKEVPGPQLPALPPLVIKQRPTPPKTPPPVIIRERPPSLPSIFATKVITRQLPPEPAPPRAVIIERLPPLPPKPRDIIIERWLPYEIVDQKRKVIVQRAQKTSQERPKPRNIIITYEPVHAKIVRNFQKQNVTREDPQAYSIRYGSHLYDANLVIQQARAMGVLEDLNPPVSFISTMATSVDTGTDYELPIAIDELPQETNNVENKESTEENTKQEDKQQPSSEETNQSLTSSSVPLQENIYEEDILVEENITPFYMNSGENLQQTLHRLGIDLPDNVLNEHHFRD